MNLRLDQAWADISQDGIPDFKEPACPGYPHYPEDRAAIDWDMAYKEIEDCIKAQDAKKKREMEQ